MAVIKMENVVKSFDGFHALDDFSMNVPKGAIYGLVGPNGSGKSTAMRHLTGVYRQDSGNVLLEGKPIFENPETKVRIANIPDELYYFVSASTKDMMKFYKGFYPSFDEKRYEALKDVFRTVDEKRPIRRLSKGMQKQSAFWLSICCKPDLLLLDEPVDGLDPVMRRQVWSLLMADVVERETTVLVSSHNLRELEDVCDHVGIVSKGKILVERSLSQLQDTVNKIQIAFPEGVQVDLPADLDILHQSSIGRVQTLIVREETDKVLAKLRALHPILLEAIPLSLEEIFIYELGGEDYAVREIVL